MSSAVSSALAQSGIAGTDSVLVALIDHLVLMTLLLLSDPLIASDGNAWVQQLIMNLLLGCPSIARLSPSRSNTIALYLTHIIVPSFVEISFAALFSNEGAKRHGLLLAEQGKGVNLQIVPSAADEALFRSVYFDIKRALKIMIFYHCNGLTEFQMRVVQYHVSISSSSWAGFYGDVGAQYESSRYMMNPQLLLLTDGLQSNSSSSSSSSSSAVVSSSAASKSAPSAVPTIASSSLPTSSSSQQVQQKSTLRPSPSKPQAVPTKTSTSVPSSTSSSSSSSSASASSSSSSSSSSKSALIIAGPKYSVGDSIIAGQFVGRIVSISFIAPSYHYEYQLTEGGPLFQTEEDILDLNQK